MPRPLPLMDRRSLPSGPILLQMLPTQQSVIFFLSLLLKLLPSKYNIFSQNSQTQHFWYPNENDWHWKWSGPTPPGRVSGVGLPLLR